MAEGAHSYNSACGNINLVQPAGTHIRTQVLGVEGKKRFLPSAPSACVRTWVTAGAGLIQIMQDHNCLVAVQCNHTHARFTVVRCQHVCTTKPVYSNHSRDQVIVVSVDRWSLYGGILVQLKWTMNQPAVVSIDRWSLRQDLLYVYSVSIQTLSDHFGILSNPKKFGSDRHLANQTNVHFTCADSDVIVCLS